MQRIFQKNDYQLESSLDAVKCFSEGSLNQGKIPVKAGKIYCFKSKIELNDNALSFSQINFKMNGNLSNLKDIDFTSKVTLLPIGTLPTVEKSHTNFGLNEILDGGSSITENTLIEIEGVFKCIENTFLQPCFSFDDFGGRIVVEGSYFMLNEIQTTSDIV
jgi:hypothetical protein